MGDYTAYQAYIYDCPEEQRGAAMGVLAAYELAPSWGAMRKFGDTSWADEPLELGQNYGDNEALCGQTDDIGENLMIAAPGATFIVWEDPKYEWLGQVYMYAPDLGGFSAECDANGNPCVEGTRVLAIIDEFDSTTDKFEDLRERIHRLYGKPWEERVEQLRKALKPEEVSDAS